MEKEPVSLEFIRTKMPEDERLAILAEEATELAHAALKMRRTLISNNPTPIDYESARAALLEEYADVVLCMSAVGCSDEDLEAITKIYEGKAFRWAKRLASDKGVCGS